MKIDCFSEVVPKWQIRRETRYNLEEKFMSFTGHIDIVELHIPYTKYKYLFELFEQTRKIKGRKILVCAGDSLNLDLFGPFYPKISEGTKPSFEIGILIKVLREAEKVYDNIIFLTTNHEGRLEKIIQRALHSREQSVELVDRMRKLSEDFKESGLKKMVVVPDCIFQIGDIVITHFENNSVVPGVIPRNVIQYLIPRLEKEWTVCYQSHTHAQSRMALERKLVIETGALCPTLDYWRSGKMTGKGKMTSLGYAQGDLLKGKSILNSCNFIICEWEGWL